VQADGVEPSVWQASRFVNDTWSNIAKSPRGVDLVTLQLRMKHVLFRLYPAARLSSGSR
jgi:hypothetical protein